MTGTHNDTMPSGVGSENLANQLFIDLVGDANATLPNVDLTDSTHTIPWDADSAVFQPVEKISIEQLVSYFHALMEGFQTHLSKEFEAGRITGAKYADTYLALTQGAMGSAVQFALGKDQAFWMAAKTQADAIIAQNQNEVMKLEAMLKRATYALTKLKLATEDSTFGVSELQRTGVLPGQIDLSAEQLAMVTEQKEAQRAQTMNTRSDGATPVTGLLGTQKRLYEQQIVSYKEDVRIKATKIFADLWVTQKTVDEGILAPDAFRAPTTSNDATNALFQIFTAAKVTAETLPTEP